MPRLLSLHPKAKLPWGKPPQFLTVKKRKESRTGLALQAFLLTIFYSEKLLNETLTLRILQ